MTTKTKIKTRLSKREHKIRKLEGKLGHSAAALALPYYCDRPTQCFVEWKAQHKLFNGHIDKYDTFKRMTLSRATKERRKIILCTYCDNPATQIDSSDGYYDEMTTCDTHTKAYNDKRLISWLSIQDICTKGSPSLFGEKECCVRCVRENCPLWKRLAQKPGEIWVKKTTKEN